MAKQFFYYQQIDEIGKEIAIVKAPKPITDTVHYREITKEYYEAVLEFLREQATEEEENGN